MLLHMTSFLPLPYITIGMYVMAGIHCFDTVDWIQRAGCVCLFLCLVRVVLIGCFVDISGALM